MAWTLKYGSENMDERGNEVNQASISWSLNLPFSAYTNA